MKRLLLVPLFLVTAATPAFAHLDPLAHGSLAAGFSHPFFGLDHILAMVAVGLWAALLGGRAIWIVPAAFVLTMLVGFGLAIGGLPVPLVEPVVLASVIVVGLLAATALQAPVALAAAMVGFLAFFHGHAHGGELGAAGAWPFAIGFASATAILHAIGIGLGLGAGGLMGRNLARGAGALTAIAGLWLALGA
jgi:urease accessory protein